MASSFPIQRPPLSFTDQKEHNPRSYVPHSAAATTQIHLVPPGASVDPWGEASSPPRALMSPASSASQSCAHRGEQLGFSWALGDPFGEDVWAVVKSRLGAWKQALTFVQGILWSWRTWRGCSSGGRRRTETPSVQVPWPSEKRAAGGQGTQGRGSSWSWSWSSVVLPRYKTLIKEPYLNVFNYLNTSGKKPGFL